MRKNLSFTNFNLLLICLVIIGCHQSNKPVIPSADELSVRMESTHFVFQMAAGDQVDTTWQESYYDWLVNRLEVVPPQKLHYFKYRDRDHLYRLTGRRTNGFAETETYNFHTIWPIDNHECVHTLVVNLIGHPPALFNEGIAVAHHSNPLTGVFEFEPYWSGTHVDTLAKQYSKGGDIPSLESLLESTSFFSFDVNKTYPISGSFVHFLIDSAGLQNIKTFFSKSTFTDNNATIREHFRSVYNNSVDEWWNRWLTFLSR